MHESFRGSVRPTRDLGSWQSAEEQATRSSSSSFSSPSQRPDGDRQQQQPPCAACVRAPLPPPPLIARLLLLTRTARSKPHLTKKQLSVPALGILNHIGFHLISMPKKRAGRVATPRDPQANHRLMPSTSIEEGLGLSHFGGTVRITSPSTPTTWNPVLFPSRLCPTGEGACEGGGYLQGTVLAQSVRTTNTETCVPFHPRR
ncbi:hypothetical protein CSHISOI_00594 [Colletotrichum shisoi]|uniref:Uncharacterized protein n=1 Tax=Colletotrichum shisoi TaxID=2078593 RepID=A0A5Q4C653_9PEZI|nr:hypothetical protein CSHISOI_00594 [Colletotrichum shisoi]